MFPLLLLLAMNTPPLEVVPSVDLNRYQGKWHEIARLPNRFERSCVRDVTATYSLLPDGGIRVVNECVDEKGKANRSEGKARLKDKRGPNTKLKVSFFWPFYGDYWIIGLDPDYQWALVAGGEDRKYLWLLSRTPKIDEALYQKLISVAKTKGFDVDRLIRPS